MTKKSDTPTVYELSFSFVVSWQAHSLSNAGSFGTNHVMPRRQLLDSGVTVDALAGNINNHHHAVLAAEYFERLGIPLCEACQRRDGRRAAALVKPPRNMREILNQCGLCDAHGFMRTAKRPTQTDPEARTKFVKSSLLDYSDYLARPDHWSESIQTSSRIGDSKEEGQMIMKRHVRSGQYAGSIRYYVVGIGMDTDKRVLLVTDQRQRATRHRAITFAIRDQLTSPSGAQTTTLLPHLTDLRGVIVLRLDAGRAPVFSALNENFIDQHLALAHRDEALKVIPFESVTDFYDRITTLAESTVPSEPGVKPFKTLRAR